MAIASNVVLGSEVSIPQPDLVNLFGCSIGDYSMIGPFVEIQANVRIGKRCRIQSHSFICEGVVLEDDVFIGHGVMFTNDRFPKASLDDGSPVTREDWTMEFTRVGHGSAIGTSCTILPGRNIGSNSLIGAGTLVSRDIPDSVIAFGNPLVIRSR
jgi:UDP-2-acetamido-3-amino-2,3-dideoxy-glucuronate N-acetyltransferase